jgi:hypothetical protein
VNDALAVPADSEPVDFERSYQEVLAFIKHEDDKINRVLTALSFLTVAGVTLFIFSGEPNLAEASFPHSSVDAANVFFVAFIVGVVLALFSALVALDPTSHRPRFLAAHARPDERSLLFYEHIAEDSTWWKSLEQAPSAELAKQLRRAYHRDTERLVARARHKVVRFAQCHAFLQFSMVSLALLAVVRLPGWSAGEHWWVTAFILAVTGFLPHWDFAVMRLTSFPGMSFRDAPKEARALLVFTLVTVASTMGLVLALFAAPLRAHWLAVAFSLGWLVLARLALPSRRAALPVATIAAAVGVVLLISIVTVRALT